MACLVFAGEPAEQEEVSDGVVGALFGGFLEDEVFVDKGLQLSASR